MADEEVSKEEIEQMEDIITRIKRQQTMEKSTSPVRYQFIINLSIPFTSPQLKANSPNTNRGRTFIFSYTWEAGRVALKKKGHVHFFEKGMS